MKQKKIYKIIVICCIILIVASAVIYKVYGYLPIVGKTLANNKVENYVQITYNKKLEQNVSFDFYNSDCYKNDSYRCSLKDDIIYDVESNKLKFINNNKIFNKIVSKYNSDIIIKDYNVSEFIDGSDFTKLYHRLTIYKIFDSKKVDKEKIAEKILGIISEFSDNYNFTGIYINYYCSNESYTISIPYNNKETITKDMIIKNITKK